MACSERVVSFFSPLITIVLLTFAFEASSATPPVITADPQSITVKVGDTASFKISVTGDSLKFFWERDSGGLINIVPVSPIDSIYKVPRPAVVGDSGKKYRCVVSNRSGSDTSAWASLTVRTAPAIVIQPVQICTVAVGATTTFFISATTYYPPMTYQWQVSPNGSTQYTGILGATDTFYTTPAAADSLYGYRYRCAVTDSAGTTKSSAGRIIVPGIAIPEIVGQPADQTVKTLDSATFKISVKSYGLTFQWQYDSAGTVTNVSGGGSARRDSVYIKRSVPFADSGKKFRCIVTNISGIDTSDFALLNVKRPPAITVNPINDTVSLGDTASFKVSATCLYPPLTFQWQRRTGGGGGGQYINIAGATDSVYRYPSVADSNYGMIVRCNVADSGGITNSSSATLYIKYPAPEILAHPTSQTVDDTATNIRFTVSAQGQRIRFQWLQDSAGVVTPVQGGGVFQRLDSVLQMSYVVFPDDSGKKFRCVAINTGGADSSSWATLHIKSTGIINLIPSFRSITRFSAFPNVVRSNRPILFVFKIIGPATITLAVYNHLGRKVYSQSWLDNSSAKGMVTREYPWDLRNNSGQTISNGAYIAMLTVNGISIHKQEKIRLEIIR
jgi:hypothetical protein